MIEYVESLQGIQVDQLKGFFVGWPNPPSPEQHLKILKNSSFIILALESKNRQVIGFINAISDQILSAYIPLLEVLPEYQGQGVGKELVQRILQRLQGFYMVDLSCDSKLMAFYEKFKMKPATAMMLRHYENQSGKSD